MCNAINVNLKSRPEFQRGALSVCDSNIRRMAIDQILVAKEFALQVGAERVTCAPLADGADYPLQKDYAGAWMRAVETLRTAIDEGPSVPLYLEHKPSDPRVNGLLSSSNIVLRLLHDIDRKGGGLHSTLGTHRLMGFRPLRPLRKCLRVACRSISTCATLRAVGIGMSFPAPTTPGICLSFFKRSLRAAMTRG